MDTQCLCNLIMMEKALIFLLFNGEDGIGCGVRCGSWYQGSMYIVQCAAIWMDTILENYTQHTPHWNFAGSYIAEDKGYVQNENVQAVIIDCIQLLHSSSGYDDCY